MVGCKKSRGVKHEYKSIFIRALSSIHFQTNMSQSTLRQNLQNCRYCAFCIPTDVDSYYCTDHRQEMSVSKIKHTNHCPDFALSELGDVDTCNVYKPRTPKTQTNDGKKENFEKMTKQRPDDEVSALLSEDALEVFDRDKNIKKETAMKYKRCLKLFRRWMVKTQKKSITPEVLLAFEGWLEVELMYSEKTIKSCFRPAIKKWREVFKTDQTIYLRPEICAYLKEAAKRTMCKSASEYLEMLVIQDAAQMKAMKHKGDIDLRGIFEG